MNIEYEATFINIDKDEIRQRLKKAGAKLIRPEFLQKMTIFDLPKGHEIEGSWLRIRDEGDKITLSLKVVAETSKIEDQKEICLEVNSQKEAEEFLKSIGCSQKALEENRREIWRMGDVEICLDEWPFLEPFVEIEGQSEKSVKKAAKKLGFDYKKARFCSADFLYAEKYDLPLEVINYQTPKILFKMKNPFIK